MNVGLGPSHHGSMNDNQSKPTIDMDAVRKTMARGVDAVHGTMARLGLTRPADGRVVAGVFSGIGRRFGLDPWTSRLAVSATLLVIPGSQLLLAYPLLWAMMPEEERAAEAATE